MISILDVLLTNPGPGRIWDRYRRGPRFGRILDWSNLGPPHPPFDDVNHKKMRANQSVKQNGTQIQVKETTLQLRGFGARKITAAADFVEVPISTVVYVTLDKAF